MADTPFYVPRLLKEGAWLDLRGRHRGGYSMYGTRALSQIVRTPMHHSVTHPSGNALKDVDSIANIHINGNGWAGIGYNFIITSEVVNGFAKVAYVGDIATVRAHTPNVKGAQGLQASTGNWYMLASCIIGMNHITKPTVAQMRSMKLLLQELIWHERGRLSGLPQSWDAAWQHFVYDWTQCNGINSIRSDIINVPIPAESKPVPQKPSISYKKITQKKIELVRDAKLWNFNFTKWSDAKAVKSYKKGDKIDVVAIATNQMGSEYYMTEYSYDDGKIKATHGFNRTDAKDVVTPKPEIPKPKPEPVPVVEKPVVRSLGAVETVYIDTNTKVVDVITGKVTRTYTAEEIRADNTFIATHIVSYMGKEYYMTAWSYQRYVSPGENPTGVDKTTVKHKVVTPTPTEPEVLPDEIPDEPQPDSQRDYDKLVDELEGRVSGLEALVKKIMDFLVETFKSFRR